MMKKSLTILFNAKLSQDYMLISQDTSCDLKMYPQEYNFTKVNLPYVKENIIKICIDKFSEKSFFANKMPSLCLFFNTIICS